MIDIKPFSCLSFSFTIPRYSEAEAQATEGLNINHQYNVRLAEIDSDKTEDIETEIVDDTSDVPLENPIE